MAFRIDIATIVEDTRARVKKAHFETLGLEGTIENVSLLDSYTVDKKLDSDQIKLAAEALTNPLLEKSFINTSHSKIDFEWAIEVGYLPGVTDTVGLTAKETIADRLGVTFQQSEGVYTSVVHFIKGSISETDAEKIAGKLHNPLIQRASIKSRASFTKDGGMGFIVPKVTLSHTPSVTSVDLRLSDNELKKIGSEGIAGKDGKTRGPLALDLSEMKAIAAYFASESRNPTDVELESLAQTWSEHCKHTIFNDPLDDIEDGLYKSYIKKATKEIGKKFCISVFKDNSGAIEFDEDHLITHKVETHNSPSALDPFGGAVTGIVGVNRDCLGFGLGAKPIANTYGFCFADPTKDVPLFRDKKREQKMLSPRRIMDGVIEGVNVGGNSSGIPTPLGFVFFDDRFAGKPLVFVGTIGIIPKKIGNQPSHKKQARPGDYIVTIGGRVGLDGIHGATFSSEDLSVKSQTTSVQIGDPIIQKKLSDALIRDARDKNLYTSITDNGAGGLSSSVGETALQSGGCEVHLEKVPLKYPGLDPWQIWISESQERMTLSVPKQKWKEFKRIMDLHDVEATVIGTFTNSGRCVVSYNDKTVMDVSLKFLHDGRPRKKQVSKPKKKSPIANNRSSKKPLEDVLKELNTTSYAFISQQFDHTVQGTFASSPLHGKGRVNADAAVLKPLVHSQKGIVTSQGINPTDSDVDTYYMASSAIDSAIRNAVAMGADPQNLALLDNFCWSSSDEPERLYELKMAVKACYDYATVFETPFISGKDSMFNDFKGFDNSGVPIKISVPPTLLISTLGVIPDVHKTVTLDFKSAGNLIYVLGDEENNPQKNKKLYMTMYEMIQQDLLSSSLAVTRGGIMVALAKSAIAGMTGIDVVLPNSSDLYRESQGRFVVTVTPKNRAIFEKTIGKNTFVRIGSVGKGDRIEVRDARGKTIKKMDLKKAVNSYHSTFAHF